MDKKLALITGATGGLGNEFANIHAATGGNLLLVGRNENKLSEMKKRLEKQYHVQIYIFSVDFSEEDAAEKIYRFVTDSKIKIDYLINNAGFGGRGEFHERTMELDMSVISVNIVTLTKLCKLILPNMVKAGSGKILNVSSTASMSPGPLQAVYYATKAYVTSLSNGIWQEIQGTGVTVTALLPGAMNTGFASASDMGNTALFANAVEPSTVAKDGYQGMLKGKINVVSGLPGWQKPFMSLMPLFPKKPILKMIYRMQQPK